MADNRVWEAHCARVFSGKAHVPARAREQRSRARARDALRLALADAHRAHLTAEELCAFDWRFRFKEAAGPGWVSEDPYWQG